MKNMKDDISRACVFIVCWAVVWNIGLFIAGVLSKPFGLLIMLSSLAVLIVKLKADGEAEAARKRLRKYQHYVMAQSEEENDDR